jgi:hypothetical protein
MVVMRRPDWVETESSAISALGYEVSRRRLGIGFQDKRQMYLYHEVPHFEFNAFLAAESKGRYLTRILPSKSYRCTGPYRSRRQAAYELFSEA